MAFTPGEIRFASMRLSTLASEAASPSAPVLALGHGAGAGLDHPHMARIAEALERRGIGTFRYNFPFMEAGKRRVDSLETCIQVIDVALAAARERFPGHPLFLAGHSFGGRMSSHYAAAHYATHYAARHQDAAINGLVFFSFPLHAARKPELRRAAHLPRIRHPMLFLSGDRDALAEKSLLTSLVDGLNHATLHFLQTADHGFKTLKRTRSIEADVYDEAAEVAASWIDGLAK